MHACAPNGFAVRQDGSLQKCLLPQWRGGVFGSYDCSAEVRTFRQWRLGLFIDPSELRNCIEMLVSIIAYMQRWVDEPRVCWCCCCCCDSFCCPSCSSWCLLLDHLLLVVRLLSALSTHLSPGSTFWFKQHGKNSGRVPGYKVLLKCYLYPGYRHGNSDKIELTYLHNIVFWLFNLSRDSMIFDRAELESDNHRSETITVFVYHGSEMI